MLAWAAGASVFFRISLLSGFKVVPGDLIDSRMIIYFHEHLFQWLLGNEQLYSPPFYYPQPSAFGYSDAFLLDLLPYSAVRLLGFDPFLSMLATAVVLSALCFASTFIILARYLRIRPLVALGGAVLITFPNNLYFKTQFGHLNFFALYYIPCIALLAVWAVEKFPDVRPWAILRVAAAASLYGLLFSTGYYTAWLFALTALTAMVVVGIALRSEVTGFIESKARPLAILLGAGAAGLAIGLIPFHVIYGPVVQLFPSRPFSEYIAYAPMPKDLVNVTAWNAIWGWLVERLLGIARASSVEQALAVTPGTTLIFFMFARAALSDKATDRAESRWTRLFTLCCVVIFAAGWLLTLKIGTFSAFWVLFHVFPGAGAIRTGDRVQLFVNIWVVSGLVLLIDRWIDSAQSAPRNRRHMLAGAILLFCVVEQVNFYESGVVRTAELAGLNAVPAPPEACRSFLLRAFAEHSGQVLEVDAMWISWKTGLPTLNDRSGWAPPGWHLSDPTANYLAAARQWIAQNGLAEQVCLYDQGSRRWSPFSLE